jgi:hypothetical protein
MKTKDFVEIESVKFAQQLGEFWSALRTHGSNLGFTNAEIDDAEKDYRWMQFVVERQEQVQGFAQGYTKFKKLLRHKGKNNLIEPQLPTPASVPTPVGGNVEARFRKRVARVKSHANYSKTIGEQMRIIAVRSTFDASSATPQFKILMNAGRPLIKFKKKFYHGFEIWKNDSNGWKKLERVSKSPYTDESDLPPQGQSAAWTYRLIGIVNDKTVGKFSPEVTIVVYGVV